MYGSSDYSIILKLERSSQSGSKIMTGAYASMYDDYDNNTWLFCGGKIDLTNMAAGDTVYLRESVKNINGGNYIVTDIRNYVGVQPADSKMISLTAFANTYGTRIEAYQSAGVLCTLNMEFFCAKR